jgi:hypothetical protein
MTETTARGGVALGRGRRMLRQRKRDAERVLGEHRYEVGDPVVSRKAGEQGDTDVHHALGFGDDDGAPAEAGEPMPLARVVPLDAVCLVFARIELPNRQEHIIDGVVVRAVEPRAPALQARDQALAGGLVTTAALPFHQLACTIVGLNGTAHEAVART